MTPFIADPQIQAEIERVAGMLRRMSVGQTLAYEAFAASRYVLAGARATVEKDDGIRFGTVRNVGVKRMAANELPEIALDGTRRLSRVAKRSLTRLSDLRAYNDMEPADRLRIAAHRMIAATVAEKTTRAAIKETEESVRNAGAAIDFGTALAGKGAAE